MISDAVSVGSQRIGALTVWRLHAELPGTFHPDLADRVTSAVLTTRDPRILDYAARGHLTAIAA
jgi:hypothetical protein